MTMNLAVHLYSYGLSLEAAGRCNNAILDWVAAKHKNYKRIFLISGVSKSFCLRPTLAETAKEVLIQKGVPREKLVTQYDVGLDEFIPPRDTFEEVYMLGAMMRAKGLIPKNTMFKSVGMHWHTNRIERANKSVGGWCLKVYGVGEEGIGLGRWLYEVICQLLLVVFPKGDGPLFNYERGQRIKHVKHINDIEGLALKALTRNVWR